MPVFDPHSSHEPAVHGAAESVPANGTGEDPALPDAEQQPARFTFSINPLAPYRGVVRRFFQVYRHTLGLLIGANLAYVRSLPPYRRRGLRAFFPRLSAFLLKPFARRDVRSLPFPQQLRRRLEMLGPTFVKFGQIMAIREDLLPRPITRELQNLFDRLPALPYEEVRRIVERSLGHPLDDLFAEVDEVPLGSASIAQAHAARLPSGERVVLKVIKPGIREMILSDLTLLRLAGRFLQWIFPQYQIRQIIEEFAAYTVKEVDFTYEADHAEMFAANFAGIDGIVFPTIYRHLSTEDVLTMAYLDGFKPGAEATRLLSDEERARILDLGALAIIKMLYQDGFFHADLHAGNLLILPGDPVRIGFIDLGMVGRFEESTRRRLLYYFHALVHGDVEAATRHITELARVGKGGDLQGFRRAAADLLRRFLVHSHTGDFSIAQMILQSVGLGGRFRVYFPVEMTLMVKALVTFEGVGRTLAPRLDVAELSRKHVARIFKDHVSPTTLANALWRNAPEVMDLMVEMPRLLAAGFRRAEHHLEAAPPPDPLRGLRGSIGGGACLISGVLSLLLGGPWPLSTLLLSLAVLLYVFDR
ncbi:MAG: AarF/ABC1/UbiB kinase family protein [Bacteroidetes bacterium]|nr:MAG: AarF/ABC1/UbiB kinase family protein [Bacteroidota bacterium]